MKKTVIGIWGFTMLTLVSCTSEQRFLSYKEVQPLENETYQKECGHCHFAHYPGFLPEPSWRKIMEESGEHFGEYVGLEPEVEEEILKYLTENSADKSGYKRSKKVMASLAEDGTPLRITQVPYLKKKHQKIPENHVIKNKDVESYSNCDACHTKADLGIFDDDTVSIPNYGRWED